MGAAARALMDLPPYHFDRDQLFEREASPFMPEQLLHFRRADLFERAAIRRLSIIVQGGAASTPIVMDGALLVSAILFGALLDRPLWTDWLTRSYGLILDMDVDPPRDWHSHLEAARQGGRGVSEGASPAPLPHLLCAGRLWIDCTVGDDDHGIEIKRWVADPLTHCLLRHWQSVREAQPPFVPAAETAIATFLGAAHWDFERQSWLTAAIHEAATTKWRLRMPGFLVDAVSEHGQSVSLPLSRWKAVLGQSTQEARLEVGKVSGKRTSSDPVRAIIQQALPVGRASPRRAFTGGAAAIADAAFANHRSPVERLVLQWAADRLDPNRNPKQRSRGLAPSTIDRRAGALLRALRTEFGDRDPRLCSRDELLRHVDTMLRGGRDGPTFVNHLKCFFDWLQRCQPELAIAFDDVGRQASGVAASVITSAEYTRVLARFDPTDARGATARLAIMLAFRAGLRWSEVIGLSTSDLRWAAETIELEVRDNAIRRTKSLAGRRLLPLHVLMDESEATELRRWWRARQAAQASASLGSDEGHATRLFPAGTDDVVATLKLILDHALREVSGDRRTNFHTLRHSFGSYLLTTLSLPGDLADSALVPHLDLHLVSQGRRARIADSLWGEGRLGQSAVHVASSLLGHSGSRSTLRSYMHLTDWLAGVYVARPSAQRGLPTSLVAALLGKTEIAVERADRRRAAVARTDAGSVPGRRPRGRQPKDDLTLGSIYLAPLLDAGEARPPMTTVIRRRISAAPDPVPGWESMLAVILADSAAAREMALDRRDLDTAFGRKVIAQLDALLAMPTRGRLGVARSRHGPLLSVRQRAPRRLDPEQVELLRRLYRGAAQLDQARRQILVDAFVNSYDRPRGVIRVLLGGAPALTEALFAIGCKVDEIAVEERPGSATVRVKMGNRTGRGFSWAMLMISAVHRATARGSRHSVS